MRRAAWFAALLILVSPCLVSAQQSASFQLQEHVFNAGGRPADGTVAASASFQITLDAIGDSVSPGLLAGGAFQVGGGFVTVYPPPGEVDQLWFTDHETLVWTPDPAAFTYNLYRGAMTAVDDLAYGDCLDTDVAGTTMTDDDPLTPGQGFFYLVTAANKIAEEGTKGYDSSVVERANDTPCP